MLKRIKGRHEAARLNQKSGVLTEKNQANVALGVTTRLSHRILTSSGAIRTHVLAIVDSKCGLTGRPNSTPMTSTLKSFSVEIRNQFKSH